METFPYFDPVQWGQSTGRPSQSALCERGVPRAEAVGMPPREGPLGGAWKFHLHISTPVRYMRSTPRAGRPNLFMRIAARLWGSKRTDLLPNARLEKQGQAVRQSSGPSRSNQDPDCIQIRFASASADAHPDILVKSGLAVISLVSSAAGRPKSSPERHLSPPAPPSLGSALGKSVRPPIRVKSLMHYASGWQQRPHDPHPPVDLGRVPDAGEAGCPVCPFVWHRTSRLLAWGSRPRARNLQGRSLPRS